MAAKQTGPTPLAAPPRSYRRGVSFGMHRGSHAISALPAAQRLALEMSLHEADERRALEGELAVLEQRWKEAEEIAAIGDDMFLPQRIIDGFRRLKDR